jgi:hypothetical protein
VFAILAQTMRSIFLGVLFFLIGISVFPQTKSKIVPSDPPDANPQYFPEGTFGDSSETGYFRSFTARWYSKRLRVMAEPSLTLATKDETLVAYRFLWLRTFHHPVGIHLTLRPDGSGSIIAKITS